MLKKSCALLLICGFVWYFKKKQKITWQNESFDQAIYALSAAMDSKDHQTFIHCNHVAIYAHQFAKLIGLSKRQQKLIKEAGLLHDIGKLAIEDQILHKPSTLSSIEYETMKEHVVHSVGMLQYIDHFKDVLPMIISHHEHFDGQGYPYQLKGSEIPIEGRILCLVDCFDAMLSKRDYKDALSLQEVLEYLHQQSGILFDPLLVYLFTKHIKEKRILIQ